MQFTYEFVYVKIKQGRDIGLYLLNICESSFLYNGLTWTILKLSGKIPVVKAWLRIRTRGAIRIFFMFLTVLLDILSKPELFVFVCY